MGAPRPRPAPRALPQPAPLHLRGHLMSRATLQSIEEGRDCLVCGRDCLMCDCDCLISGLGCLVCAEFTRQGAAPRPRTAPRALPDPRLCSCVGMWGLGCGGWGVGCRVWGYGSHRRRSAPRRPRRGRFTEMCCGTLRLIDSCITQRKAQGPSRTCNESKEEEELRVRTDDAAARAGLGGGGGGRGRGSCVQGYLACKKPPPRRTLQ